MITLIQSLVQQVLHDQQTEVIVVSYTLHTLLHFARHVQQTHYSLVEDRNHLLQQLGQSSSHLHIVQVHIESVLTGLFQTVDQLVLGSQNGV